MVERWFRHSWTVAGTFYRALDTTAIVLTTPPRLASWNRAEHPDQEALTRALEDGAAQLVEPIHGVTGPCALSLDIGLPAHVDLLRHHDLDNYAYPLARHLAEQAGREFEVVWASKRHAEHSAARVGEALPVDAEEDWPFQRSLSTTASADTVAYKEQIHAGLAGQDPIADGALALDIAFRVGTQRNWINLWKPTIDAFGLILGTDASARRWHARDDRIVKLGLHRTVDANLGHVVQLDLRAALVLR